MSWLWSINMPAYVLFSPHRISFTAPTVGFPVQWSSAHRSFLLANIMYLSAVVTWSEFNNSSSTKIHHIYTLYRWIVYTFASKAAPQQTMRCSAASWRFCLPLSLYIYIYIQKMWNASTEARLILLPAFHMDWTFVLCACTDESTDTKYEVKDEQQKQCRYLFYKSYKNQYCKTSRVIKPVQVVFFFSFSS